MGSLDVQKAQQRNIEAFEKGKVTWEERNRNKQSVTNSLIVNAVLGFFSGAIIFLSANNILPNVSPILLAVSWIIGIYAAIRLLQFDIDPERCPPSQALKLVSQLKNPNIEMPELNEALQDIEGFFPYFSFSEATMKNIKQFKRDLLLTNLRNWLKIKDKWTELYTKEILPYLPELPDPKLLDL